MEIKFHSKQNISDAVKELCNMKDKANFNLLFSSEITKLLTLTLKIVYLDTTDILQLNYYIQHIGNKKYVGCAKETI